MPGFQFFVAPVHLALLSEHLLKKTLAVVKLKQVKVHIFA
jgi:hypothetical protein